MATATRERTAAERGLETPDESGVGEDGYPVRHELVDGERVPFSLKPYPADERPLYWNSGGTGEQPLLLRSSLPDERGRRPIVQREAWSDGKYRPRNAWEEHLTRVWMTRNIAGCANPDEWKGNDHPKGPGYAWRCANCGWQCGNIHAFEQHQLSLGHHRGMTSVKTTG